MLCLKSGKIKSSAPLMRRLENEASAEAFIHAENGENKRIHDIVRQNKSKTLEKPGKRPFSGLCCIYTIVYNKPHKEIKTARAAPLFATL